MSQAQRRFVMALKSLRAQRGWSQAALAAKAGISPEYLARLELGQQEPTLGTLVKLAKALRVKVSALIE